MMNIIFSVVLVLVIGTLAGKLIVTTKRLNEVYNANMELSKAYEEVATKLDSIKEVDILSAPEVEITEELDKDFRRTFCEYYEDFRKSYVEGQTKARIEHEDMIRNIIDILQAEGLINKHLTIELTDNLDSMDNYCKTHTVNGQQYNRTIRVSYNFRDNGFLMDYINNVYGLNLRDNDESLRIFTFLHEFGHYVDSTLDHEEGYEEMNQGLKQKLYNIADEEEMQLAYRQIPCEAFADKWAVDFMRKHYPQYC